MVVAEEQLTAVVVVSVDDLDHRAAHVGQLEYELPFDVLELSAHDLPPRAVLVEPEGEELVLDAEVESEEFVDECNVVIDLTDLEQLRELSQTKAIAYALVYAKKYMDGTKTIYEVIRKVMNDIEQYGLDIINERISGHFALFRDLELAFTLNRLRSLEVVQSGSI